MTISELIKQLEAIKEERGDLDVCVQSLTHKWPPEPEVRPIHSGHPNGPKYVLLNP